MCSGLRKYFISMRLEDYLKFENPIKIEFIHIKEDKDYKRKRGK